MKKTALDAGEDLENKQTVANQNAKINDSAKRVADADDEVDADEYYDDEIDENGEYTGKSIDELKQIYYDVIDFWEQFGGFEKLDNPTNDREQIGYDVIGEEGEFFENTDLYFDLIDYCDYVLRPSGSRDIDTDKFAAWLGATAICEVEDPETGYIESYYYA